MWTESIFYKHQALHLETQICNLNKVQSLHSTNTETEIDGEPNETRWDGSNKPNEHAAKLANAHQTVRGVGSCSLSLSLWDWLHLGDLLKRLMIQIMIKNYYNEYELSAAQSVSVQLASRDKPISLMACSLFGQLHASQQFAPAATLENNNKPQHICSKTTQIYLIPNWQSTISDYSIQLRRLEEE